MQRNISNNVQLGQSLNSLKDSSGIESVDYSAGFSNMLNKLDLSFYMIADLWMLI